MSECLTSSKVSFSMMITLPDTSPFISSKLLSSIDVNRKFFLALSLSLPFVSPVGHTSVYFMLFCLCAPSQCFLFKLGSVFSIQPIRYHILSSTIYPSETDSSSCERVALLCRVLSRGISICMASIIIFTRLFERKLNKKKLFTKKFEFFLFVCIAFILFL